MFAHQQTEQISTKNHFLITTKPIPMENENYEIIVLFSNNAL